MTDDTDNSGWLTDALQDSVQRVTRRVLGVEREGNVCDDCGVACEATTVYDPRRAAFDDGATPAWECPDCGTAYRRDPDTEAFSGRFYRRE